MLTIVTEDATRRGGGEGEDMECTLLSVTTLRSHAPLPWQATATTVRVYYPVHFSACTEGRSVSLQHVLAVESNGGTRPLASGIGNAMLFPPIHVYLLKS